ncbi:MAG TPA: glycerol-3-phosphate dehydrogenase/oxidase [Rhizomicrobium sp.]|nr:glycerol-3-phosphate dehydrogenase/oxidase [Rhizomicrobium sp.]
MRPPVTPTSRGEAIERLRSEIFDVLVIGGGINGAGTARDLALRAKNAQHPLRIALVDQNHFASGTSSKNSHLIHGGLRYLKQLDFALVREALHERKVLLHIAPHLVEPLPFLLPVAGRAREIFYHLGLTIYDSFSDGFPRHRRLPLDEVHELEPGLAVPGMTAAAEYYDAQVRSARLVLENIFEAIANGAACANYIRLESHESRGEWRVQLHDMISDERFEARARALVDATGPWARGPAPRLVRGSHIVLPRLNRSDHAVAYFESSGRIVFFIPWGERRDRTLIGTTDVDHSGSPDDVEISSDETAYLRAIAAKIFPESASLQPVASFSSLRPLLASHGSATGATREHRIFYDPNGILRITGGKFTTYRAMAEEAADLLTAKVAPHLKDIHATAETALNGNTSDAINALLSNASAIAGEYPVEPAEINRLVSQYGVLAPAVWEGMNEPSFPGLSRIDAARMRFAIDHEMAQYPADFLEVSTSLAHDGRGNLLPPGAWPPRKSIQ